VKVVFRLVLLAALAAAGFWLWTIFFPTPEKIVRKRLAQVAGEASFKPGENPLVIAARSEALAGFFSTNVEMNIAALEHGDREFAGLENASISRAEIAKTTALARKKLGSLRVEFPEINVTIGPDKLSAIAVAVVKARTAGEKEVFVQEVKFTFQKIDGDWLITRVETVRALS
jgi:hypothetical protein